MFLLVTDTIIYSLKGQETVIRNLRVHADHPMHICVITMMELYFGANRSRQVEPNLAKVRTIEEAFTILPVGPECAAVFGKLKSDLQVSGKPLDDFDLIIASVALAHNLTVVTNNEKNFSRIPGLHFENWCA